MLEVNQKKIGEQDALVLCTFSQGAIWGRILLLKSFILLVKAWGVNTLCHIWDLLQKLKFLLVIVEHERLFCGGRRNWVSEG
jgi:hypothetical protein